MHCETPIFLHKSYFTILTPSFNSLHWAIQVSLSWSRELFEFVFCFTSHCFVEKYQQTTTTLGYGDVSAELYSGTRAQRVFLIFYLIIATGFVAKALGILASLGTDVNDMRRKAAWERRSISQAMINEIDADGDGQIDEYEYVIASLVQLRTVELGDVTEIMDKFRKLAKGGKTLHIGLQDNNEDGDDDGTEAGDSDDESGDDGDESGDDGDESDDDEGDDSV